ncbi:hypothetical protein [Desulfococcus sp.]|uniref:hypothetical protein n=1 Tax=Desulfococcus sp. TaxID=2025834 RepID=UPI003593D47C
MVILNTTDDTIDENVCTNLNPTRVVFTTECEPDPESETGDDGGGWIPLLLAGIGAICLGRSACQ